jgi:Tol biopolymer transport system component
MARVKKTEPNSPKRKAAMTEKSINETPLESWKEIAAYLQRDERTARRWEKDEGLPVHRHQHLSRSSVYAYPSEVDAWRAGRGPVQSTAGWWRPVPAFASTIVIALSLMMAGSGPHIGSVVQAADGIVARQVWTGSGGYVADAVSPDGRYLVFTDFSTKYGDLAVRDLVTGQNRYLTNEARVEESAGFAAISSDGQQVAYQWRTVGGPYDLRVIGLDGSEPRVIYRSKDGRSIVPRDWAPDGKHILAWCYKGFPPAVHQLVTVSVADGTVNELRTLEGPYDVGYSRKMSFSPDGGYIAYDFAPRQAPSNHDIFLLSADGSREIPLVEHPADDLVLGWAPDGQSVLFASNRTGNWAIWMAPVGQSQVSPKLVKRDTGQIFPLGITKQGSFYYAVANAMTDVYTATVDLATGTILGRPVPAIQRNMGHNFGSSWSPDGKYFAYYSRRGPPSEPSVLCIRDEETGEERELSPDLKTMRDLRWFPDGRSLAIFGHDYEGHLGHYRVDAQTGATTALLAVDPGISRISPSPAPDGKKIFYVRNSWKERISQIMLRDVETGQEMEVCRAPEKSNFTFVALSPDGRKLASNIYRGQHAPYSLAVITTNRGELKQLLTVQSPEWIGKVTWTPDGSQLLFIRRTAGPAESKKAELWRISAEGGEPVSMGLSASGVSIHPDGRRIAFTAGDRTNDVWVMENFLPESIARAEGMANND